MEARTLPGHGETLLIVDDEHLMTDLFTQSMSKRGFHVLAANDGQSALELLHAQKENVRIVITDMTMPGMDGIALSRELYSLDPELPVLIATGHDTDVQQLGVLSNVLGVVKKPYQIKALAEMIRSLLDSQSHP